MRVYFSTKLAAPEWQEVVPGRPEPLSAGGLLRLEWEAGEPDPTWADGAPVTPAGSPKALEMAALPDDDGLLCFRERPPGGDSREWWLDFPPQAWASSECVEALRGLVEQARPWISEGYWSWGWARELSRGAELPLLSRPEAIASRGEGWLLDPTDQALKFLMAVCERPRSHLRHEEALRPVELVRRTGPAALRHLAAHSEHWESRTVTGLRPARLLAQTVEQDLAIYENRFVCFLVDELRRKVQYYHREVEIALELAGLAGGLGGELQGIDRRAWPLLAELLNPFLKEALAVSPRLRGLKQQIERILCWLDQARSTPFYREVCKAEPVRNAHATNILSMDPNYSPLYQLWLLLRRHEVKPERDRAGKQARSLEEEYGEFCRLTMLSALRNGGYEPEEGDDQVCVRSTEAGRLALEGRYRRGGWSVEVRSLESPYRPGSLRLVFERFPDLRLEFPTGSPEVPSLPSLPQELRGFCRLERSSLAFERSPTPAGWKVLVDLLRPNRPARGLRTLEERQAQNRFVLWQDRVQDARRSLEREHRREVCLVPVLADPGKTEDWVERNTRSLLEEATELANDEGYQSVLLLCPFRLRTPDRDLRAQLYRRLLNHGDRHVPADAGRWGHYRAGILPVAPEELHSVWRLMRCLSLHTDAVDIAEGRELRLCPVCAASLPPGSLSADGQHCPTCGARWNRQRCPRQECGAWYPWMTDGEADADDLPTDPARFLDRWEKRAAGSAFTALCHPSTSEVEPAPICPHCGHCRHGGGSAKDCDGC